MQLRILFVATHPAMGTGYARVGARLAADMARLGVSVTYWGTQYDEDRAAREVPVTDGMTVIDVAARERRAGTSRAVGLGEGLIATFLADAPHDAVLVYNDPLVVAAFVDALADTDVPVHAYLDLVSDYLGQTFVPRLARLRSLAVFTEARAAWLRTALPPPPDGPRVGVVPHGVDPETFFPVDRQIARAAVLGAEAADAFLFLVSATNVFRKRLDVSVAAFVSVYARWLATPEDARPREPGLVLFSPAGSFPLGAVLWSEMARHGLDPGAHAESVRVVDGAGSLGDDELNLVFNACDAGLHASGAEGFGLGAVEHALTGAPQVYTAGLGDAADVVFAGDGEDPALGYPVRPCGWIFTPVSEDGVGGRVAQLDVEELASAMWRCLTEDPDRAAARTRVLERLPWEGVAEALLAGIRGA